MCLVSLWLETALFFTVIQVTAGRGTLTVNPTIPEKKQMATISCSSTYGHYTIKLNNTVMTTCNTETCLPTANKDRSHTYSVINRVVTVTIVSLDRDRDQGTWTCWSRGEDSIELLVYTFPSSLSLSYGGNTEGDLARSSVTLQCHTDTCTYPTPSMKWFYSDTTSLVKHTLYNATRTEVKVAGGSCAFPENIFTINLTLPLHTTWPDNSDKTVTFFCGIEYSNSSRNLYSLASKGIRFAVEVASVFLSVSNNFVVYEGYPEVLTCTSSPSRPIATISWTLGTRKLTNNIITTITTDSTGLHTTISQIYLTVKRSDLNQSISCHGFIDNQLPVSSSPHPVTVWYKPSTPNVIIDGNVHISFPWIENTTGILQCYSSDHGNPISNVIWVSDKGNADSYGNLVIAGLTPNDNGKHVSCKLVNTFTTDKDLQIVSEPLTLDVEYSPIITYNVTSPITVNETQSVSVMCEASGNPTPSVIRWKNRQDGNVLMFGNLSKQDTGTYTCGATATSRKYGTLTSQKQLDIIVQYAPVLRVVVPDTNVQNQTAVLVCEAHGVPAKNTFYPWVHMWGNEVIRTGLQGINNATQSTLTIDRMLLANKGKYICSASNGIIGNNGKFEQTGSEVLRITGVPNILLENTSFAGEIDQFINISVPFYSDPAVKSFTIQKKTTTVGIASRINIYLTHVAIDYVMYGKTVQLEAQTAHIIFQNLSQSDFDNYTLVLMNLIGQTEFTFQLIPYGPPLPLQRFYFNRFMDDQIVFNFDPGFNGGHDQTFAIEYKAAFGPNSTWQSTDIKTFQERERQYRLPNGTFSVNVRQPPPGFYLYRMYSWNVKGKSAFSDYIPIIIPSVTGGDKYNAGYQNTVIVGHGIGTTVLAVTIIALVIFILTNRSRQKTKQTDKPFEENDVPRHEVETGLIPTGYNTDISNVYERLQYEGQVDNPYLGLHRISAATREIDSRIEAERFSLHTSKISSTSNEQESITSSKSEIHSYLEVAEPTPWFIEETANRSPDTYMLDTFHSVNGHDDEGIAEAGHDLYENTTVFQ